MDYKIPGTKLPDLTPEHKFITYDNHQPTNFGDTFNYKGLISFGYNIIDGETYIKAELPTYTASLYYLIKLSDIPNNVKGYVFTKHEYQNAACAITGAPKVDKFMVNSAIFFSLKGAGVLDIWCEPIYSRFKIGDWVKVKITSHVEQIGQIVGLGACDHIISINDIEGLYDDSRLSLATKPEIIEALSALSKGLRFKRIQENIENANKGWNNPEKTFAAEWAKEVEHGILKTLLDNKYGEVQIQVTPEIRVSIATIIQWLGTHVGMAFIRDVLDKEGYNIIKR